MKSDPRPDGPHDCVPRPPLHSAFRFNTPFILQLGRHSLQQTGLGRRLATGKETEGGGNRPRTTGIGYNSHQPSAGRCCLSATPARTIQGCRGHPTGWPSEYVTKSTSIPEARGIQKAHLSHANMNATWNWFCNHNGNQLSRTIFCSVFSVQMCMEVCDPPFASKHCCCPRPLLCGQVPVSEPCLRL